MAQPKKRKSEVYNDLYATDSVDHPNTKKEKHWFEENDSNNAENRRSSTSLFKGFLKKMKSSTTLKHTNKASSSSKFEPIAANETQVSLNSESSITSAEANSDPIVSNVGRNAGLRTFVNAESLTPVPPPENAEKKEAGPTDDSISMCSHMSIDTIGSNHGLDEDEMSIGSASAFCTPSRNPLQRNGLRMSTRSVPEGDDIPAPSLFRSLCNSAVRRAPGSKDNLSTPMRRSMRMSIQKRNMTAKSMEDVPEEEALTVSSNSALRLDSAIEEDTNGEADQSIDEGNGSFSRLSTTSEEPRKSCGSSSIGRRNSIFKMFSSKSGKERRMSEVLPSDFHQDVSTRERRASIVSFSNECSFGGNLAASESHMSLASTDSTHKPKMRKKAPSTSNLTQRLSSVFRRNSSSAFKDDDVHLPTPTQTTSRRNTLTGYSSISSGIGSIASGISDGGYGTLGQRSGHSISRNGSKREDEGRRERSRRLLERIVISDIPADELLKLKIEQIKRQKQRVLDEQLNESGASSQSLQNEVLNFDVVALDLKADGSPFSAISSAFMDQGVRQMVADEMKGNYRPDRCGAVTDCEPHMVFVCQEPQQCTMKNQNDSMCSTSDQNSDLLRNVRSALCKSLEEWKKVSAGRDESTMLIFPMFCSSEADWDAAATIDAIFLMLDGILQNPKRWRTNGKCVLAGITENNVRLLREKYEEVKQSVKVTTDECDGLSHSDNLDVLSVTSTTTVFGSN